MTLMEQFANPEYFGNLSMGERLTGATVTMCMGLGITFLILCILWLLISILSRTIGTAQKKEAPAAAPVQEAAAPAAKPVEASADETDNAELVAVIAAAIAASENTFVSNLVVKKITRVQGPTNAWNSAGLSECIDSRRM